MGGDYITTNFGIGLVHTTQGYSQEDFLTGMKYKLPVLSPVDDNGKFSEETGSLLVWMSWVMEIWQFSRA